MNARARMSSKGQIVLPKAVRDAHGWSEGTEFEVVDAEGCVVLKPAPSHSRPSISFAEFVAMIPEYKGPPITSEMIEEAVVEETRRRWNAKVR